MKESAGLPPGGNQLRRDWTQGSIARNLWSLSWPILTVNTLNTIGPAIDMVWIGKLGAASIAGVGVSGLVVLVVNSVLSGLFIGAMAMIARFVGARDEHQANRVAQQAFVVGVGFSFLMMIIGVLFSERILALMGVDERVIAEGAIYLRIQLIGILTLCLVQVPQSIMQASGDPINPLKISVGYRLVQMALCPLLVFGWGFFPRLGVSGAAFSNVITQALGAVYALWVIFTRRTRLALTFHNFVLDGNIILRMVKIGIPASFSYVQKNLVELVLIWFISPFGTLAVAAQSLSQRIDQFLQNLSGGLGNAGGVLAGQNLGAGQPERALKTGWLAVMMATAISLLCAMIIWFWSVPLLEIFNKDADLVNMASSFLKIQIISYLVWGLVVSLSQVLNGVGDTLVPMTTNIITMLGVELSLAYFLPRHTSLGVYGVRWSIVIGIVLRALIYPLYFNAGRWKKRKV